MENEYKSTREMYRNYRSHRRTCRAERERREREAVGEAFFMRCVTLAVIGLFIYIAATSDTDIGKKISEKAEELIGENFYAEKIADIGESIMNTTVKGDIRIDEEEAEKINKKEKIYSENNEIKN